MGRHFAAKKCLALTFSHFMSTSHQIAIGQASRAKPIAPPTLSETVRAVETMLLHVEEEEESELNKMGGKCERHGLRLSGRPSR